MIYKIDVHNNKNSNNDAIKNALYRQKQNHDFRNKNKQDDVKQCVKSFSYVKNVSRFYKAQGILS